MLPIFETPIVLYFIKCNTIQYILSGSRNLIERLATYKTNE